MTPQVLAAFASIGGALLFFAAGFLLARASGAKRLAVERDAFRLAHEKTKTSLEEASAALGASQRSESALMASLQAAEKELHERQERVRALENDIARSRDRLESQLPEITGGGTSLLEVVESVTSSLHALRSETREQEARIRTLEHEATERRANLSALETALNEASATEARLQKRVETLQVAERTVASETRKRIQGETRVSELESNLWQATEEAKRSEATLQKQLEAALRERQELLGRLEALEMTLTACQAQESRSRSVLEALQGEKQRLEAKGREAERLAAQEAALRHELDAARLELVAAASLRERTNRLEAEKALLKEQTQAQRIEIARLKPYETLATDYGRLKLEVDVLRRRSIDAEAAAEERARAKLALAELHERLEAAQEALKGMKALEGRRYDLSLQVDLLRAQLTDLEGLREKNRELTAATEEVERLHAQVKTLEAERARLRSLVAIHEAPAPRPSVISATGGLGGLLERLTNLLGTRSNARGVVISDQLGLVVAGEGEHMEALAGLAALFGDMTRKAQSLLPLSQVQSLSMSDENALTFTVQPIGVDAETLVLATLTAGAGPVRDDLETSMREAMASQSGAEAGEN